MAFRGESPEGRGAAAPNKDLRCKGGNLRNGANAGGSYLNLTNRLGNANWNILA